MRNVLLLHGGAGPQSVAPFAARLAAERPANVLTPTHPGFDGTPRPPEIGDVPALARHYRDLLDERDLTDVTVVGNSIGGWIAAELALLGSPRVTSLVLVDAVGIEVPGHPVIDFFNVPLPEIANHSFYEPDRFRIDPAAMSEEARAAMAGNRATLAVYSGPHDMADPSLLGRLPAVTVPTLVVWGSHDGIAGPEYGKAFAAAIPGARFVLLEHTGHLPQLESPAALLETIWPLSSFPQPSSFSQL